MRKALGLLAILVVLVALTGCIWKPMESPTTQPLWGVWGISASDIFAVGGFMSPTILHCDDGANWSEMVTPTLPDMYNLWEVWGTAHDDVFAVGCADPGNYGVVLHYDGINWTDMGGSHPKYLYDVWGTAHDDVFAVGGHEGIGSVIEHYDGIEWEVVWSDDGDWGLNAVWGSAPDNVFAVGDKGIILHYDGITWDHMIHFFPVDLLDVFGRSATQVYAVGQGGIILYYDGNPSDLWIPETVNSTATLFGIARSWAVGEGGVILLQDSDTKEWNPYQTASDHLFDIWEYRGNPYRYYAVGNNGIIWDYPHEFSTSAVTPVELEWQDKAPGKMQIQFKNVGTEDVFNVTATITSWPANVRVTDPTVTIGDIPAGESAWSKDTITIKGGKPNLASAGRGISWRIEYDDAQGKHHVIDKHVGWRQISGIADSLR